MKFLTILLFFFFSITNIKAQYQIAASSIEIEHQKDQKYLIKLKLVRPCNSNPYTGNAKVEISSAGCTGLTLNLVNTNIKKIDFSCLDSLGIKYGGCNTPNQTTAAGFELFTYATSIDISKAPFNSGCCEYKFSTTNVFSNLATANWYGGITSGQGNKSAKTEMNIDVCMFKKYQNSGPIGHDNLITPMILNQPTATHLSFVDFHDSLAYEFASPLDRNGNKLAYSSGYAANGPVSDNVLDTFFLDQYGDIIGTATKNNELGLTCLLVKEYKKDSNNQYQLIGSYRNDILFATYISRDNNAPKLLGPYAYQVCEGEKLCFDVRSKDDPVIVPPPGMSPPADTIRLFWNKSIPNATFKIKDLTVRERVGEFCWEPQIGEGSRLPYNFTVNASETGCGNPVSTTRGYSITVLELPRLEKNVQVINGNELIIRAKVLNPYSKNLSCLMNIKNLGQTQVIDTRSLITHQWNDSLFEFRAPYNVLGKYVVELVFNDSKNCPIITLDTVEFTAPTQITEIERSTILFYETESHQLKWKSLSTIQNIVLIDMAGRIVLDQSVNKSSTYIALPKPAKGIYSVLLKTPQGVIKKKIWLE